METILAVIAHDKEKQSDHLRAIHKSREGAEKKIEQLKREYIEQIGVDDFNTYYSLRIEEVETED